MSMEIELNKWIELMGWCPSQCYYYFMDGKTLKCIYLRWRWSDPWTVDLITFPSLNPDWGNAKWEAVDLGYFRDEEYKRLQEKAVRRKTEIHI